MKSKSALGKLYHSSTTGDKVHFLLSLKFGKENGLKQMLLWFPGLFLWLFNVLAPVVGKYFVFILQKQENLRKPSCAAHRLKTLPLTMGK